jgi:DNA-binding response OmpR family regulator
VPRKVLVVDDDPVIQRLLQVNFEMEGWKVVIADDGVAGLEAARAEKPDCILLDVMMPKKDGLTVAAELKADPDTAGIPVVLLSAKAQAGDLGAGMATGADEYITKPFDPLELLDRVIALIEGE